MTSKKELDQKATQLLRKSGYTWAGNKSTSELIVNRKMEKSLRAPGCFGRKN